MKKIKNKNKQTKNPPENKTNHHSSNLPAHLKSVFGDKDKCKHSFTWNGLPELLQSFDEIMLNLISAVVLIMGRKKEQEGKKKKNKPPQPAGLHRQTLPWHL